MHGFLPMVLDGCKWPVSHYDRLYLSLCKMGARSYLVTKEINNRKKMNEGTRKYIVQQKKCRDLTLFYIY
jgi:hypothetical protein